MRTYVLKCNLCQSISAPKLFLVILLIVKLIYSPFISVVDDNIIYNNAVYLAIDPPYFMLLILVSVGQGRYTFHSHLTHDFTFPCRWVMFLNTWSVRVALHSVSSRSHSLSDSSRLFRMMCNSLSVSVSKLLEYKRKIASWTASCAWRDTFDNGPLDSELYIYFQRWLDMQKHKYFNRNSLAQNNFDTFCLWKVL